MEHHADRVVAVCAGVRENVDPEGGEQTVVVGAEIHGHPHRVAVGCPGHLVGAGHLVDAGATGTQGGDGGEILGQHLLFAAETAADAAAEHPDLLRRQLEKPGEFVAHQEGDLRARADDQTSGGIGPGDRTVGFQLCVGDPSGAPRSVHGRRRRSEGFVDVAAEALVEGGDEVAFGIHHPVFGGAVGVDDRSPGSACLLGVEDRGQFLVVDSDQRGGLFRDSRCRRDDGRDALPDETHDAIEDEGVVRVFEPVLVAPRGKPWCRDVLVGQDHLHAGEGRGVGRVDRDDTGVGVRRPEHVDVQRAVDRDVEGVGLGAGHDAPRRGRVHRVAHTGGFTGAPARAGPAGRHGVADRVPDRAVSGAAADVSLHPPRQVGEVVRGEGRGGDDHARGAETALEAEIVDEGLLHRVQVVGCTEAGDRGHRPPGDALRREDAGVHGLSVDEDRTRAAIACVATLLHLEVRVLAEQHPEALSRSGFGIDRLAVDLELHRSTSSL